MGYSLSVCCKSPKARDRLAEFLRGAMRPFSLVCGERTDVRDALDKWNDENLPENMKGMYPLPDGLNRDYDPTQFVFVGDELAYGAETNKVGFNFSTQGDMGIYMYAVLKWAALHSGRKRGLNALSYVGRAGQSVPYITYDSHPDPVLSESMILDWSESEQKEARQRRWVVNPLGLWPIGEFSHYFRRRYGDADIDITLGERRSLIESFYQRDKALHTITEQEMGRLDGLWNEFTG